MREAEGARAASVGARDRDAHQQRQQQLGAQCRVLAPADRLLRRLDHARPHDPPQQHAALVLGGRRVGQRAAEGELSRLSQRVISRSAMACRSATGGRRRASRSSSARTASRALLAAAVARDEGRIDAGALADLARRRTVVAALVAERASGVERRARGRLGVATAGGLGVGDAALRVSCAALRRRPRSRRTHPRGRARQHRAAFSVEDARPDAGADGGFFHPSCCARVAHLDPRLVGDRERRRQHDRQHGGHDADGRAGDGNAS